MRPNEACDHAPISAARLAMELPRRAAAVRRAALNRHGRLLGAFSALIGTQISNAVLGLVFWTVATRSYSSADVGVAAAGVSLMTLLAMFGMLGLGTLLISELPRLGRRQQNRLFLVGVSTSAAFSALLGAACLIAAPLLGTSYGPLAADPFMSLAFVVGAAATAAAGVFDQAVLGIGMGREQLRRNFLASLGKVAVLALLLGAWRMPGHRAMLWAWSGTLAASILLGGLALRRGRGSDDVRNVAAIAWRPMVRAALDHHFLNLALQSSSLLLPVLVAIEQSSREVAYFNASKQLSGFVLLLPFMLSIALFATTANDEPALLQRLRFTVSLGLGIAATAYIVLLPIAPTVLQIFGGEYAKQGATALRLLALGGLPLVVKDHYVALRRVQGQTRRAAKAIAVSTLAEVGAAFAGGSIAGLTGLCLGWLAALTLEGAVMGRTLLVARKRFMEDDESFMGPLEGGRRNAARA